jgi:glycosidase
MEKVPTIYLSNHDHAHVTWRAGATDDRGGMNWFRTQPYVIALYTSPATPMVQNGQEYGEDYWIVESDEGTGRRVNPRPLRWKRSKDRIGQALLKLYTRMAEIRTQYAGLRSANFYPQPWETWQTQFNPQGYGLDVARQIAIYHRWGPDEQGKLQRFIIVLNFSDQPQDVSVPFPENGEWVDLLSGYSGSWKPVVTNYRLAFQVGPNWGHVFYK